MDVFSKVAQLSEHVGFYALTLQSLDDDSTAFYKSLNLAKKPESPKLFWLTYRHFDGRAADVVVIESRPSPRTPGGFAGWRRSSMWCRTMLNTT
jgi:hypothetical protein